MHNGEEYDLAYDAIEDYFGKFDTIDPEDIMALNCLLKAETDVLWNISKKDTDLIVSDLEALRENSFKWEDVEVATIQKRFDFIIMFNKKINSSYLSILNLAPIFQLYTLEYIKFLTDTPNYYYGTPLYNRSLDFYTELMNFFIIHYLERGLTGLDKIVAEEIETLSPLNRIEIRTKNLRNTEVVNKFFGESFNAHKFVLNIIDKFIPGASWRFIGGKHKCHFYSVKIAKILIEYGFLNDHQIDEVLNVLYQKIPIFIRLEELIDIDSTKIDHKWIKIWADGFREVREYFIEILIHQVYLKQDNEVLKMVEKLSSKPTSTFTLTEADRIVSFQETVLFQQEFGKKVLDILLGYILSQNTILGDVLTTSKVEKIAINFLFIFSNTQDPYLQSLKLLDDFAIKDFLKRRYTPESDYLKDYSRKLMTLSRETSEGVYYKDEIKCLDQIDLILNDLITKLKKSNNKTLQMQLSSTNIISMILDMVMIYYEIIIEKKRKDIGKTFLNFIREYLRNNSEAHCLFFQDYNMNILNEFLKDFPIELTKVMFELMGENLGVAIIDPGQNRMLLTLLEKVWDFIREENDSQEFYYTAGINLFKTLQLFLDSKKYKNIHTLPEYDLNFSTILNKNIGEIDLEFVKKGIIDEDSLQEQKMKFEFIFEYLNTIQITMLWRFTYESYKELAKPELFTLENVLQLIELSGDKLKFRNVFLEFLDILYMDPKNELISGRDELDPNLKDDPYNEPQFFDIGYETVIKFCIKELEYMCMLNKDSKNFTLNLYNDYTKEHVMTSIMKLSVYFSLIRSKGIQDVVHLIEPLKSLDEALNDNAAKIFQIFSINEKSISSVPEIKSKAKDNQYSDSSRIPTIELSKLKFSSASSQRKILKDICSSIYEFCQIVLNDQVLRPKHNKMLTKKDLSLRLAKTTRVIKSFSNKMESRKEAYIFDQKNKERLDIVKVLVKSYEMFKVEKLSVRKNENVYIAPLNDENSTENQRFCKNLCIFTINQLKKEWKISNLNYFYKIIECLCNCLFISTESLQSNIYIALQEDPNKKDSPLNIEVLDKIWNHLLNLLNFVKYKTTIDRVWKESFQRALLFIKFHQYLCEDVNELFKSVMGTKTLPVNNDLRVVASLNILENFCVNLGWSIEYKENELGMFTRSQRHHLLAVGVYLFDFLEEVTSGPYFPNQELVYTRGYDMIRGILKRYVNDINSDFYKIKVSLVNYIIAVQEGQNEKIINNQTTELELHVLNEVMINSLKQLFKMMIQKKSMNFTYDETLNFDNKHNLKFSYDLNEEFSSHPLLDISVKLFSYIKMVSQKKLKFKSFCFDREEAIMEYKESKQWHKTIIPEEDLVVYDFLSEIVNKIEIVRSKDNSIEELYFMVPSKCGYISRVSQKKFFKKVDRKSHGTKLIGLINNVRFFNTEMEHMHGVFKKNPKIYQWIGPYFNKIIEIILLIVSVLINLLLLVDMEIKDNNRRYTGRFENAIYILAILNATLSLIGFLAWIFTQSKLIRIMSREEFISKHSRPKGLYLYDKIWINFYMSLLSRGDAVVFLIHFACSLLGILESQGFYGIQLLNVINLSETLQLLVKSTTSHFSQLAATYILGLITMYSYALFSHVYFIRGYNSPDNLMRNPNTAIPSHCDSLFHCFFSVINEAFSNNQGIGLLMKTESYNSANYKFINTY